MRELKDSTAVGIGAIPVEWDCIRVKFLISGMTDGTHGTYERIQDGKPLLSAKNVFYNGIKIGDNESQISLEDYNYITANGFPRKNDVLLCCVGTIGRCTLYPFDEPMAFQRSVIFLRCNDSILPRMLNYAMMCDSTMAQEQILINQAAQAGLYQGAVKELVLPVPHTIEEQKMIVNFLDERCDKIDDAISRHQTIIEKLEEYKRALIVASVSGGLSSEDKNDSDIKWMSEVPVSWNVFPLWVLFKERKNKNSKGAETNLLSLSYGKIKRKDIETNEGLLPENFNGYNIIEDGDIVLRLTDLQNDMRSLRTGLVTEHGIITSAYITLEPVVKLNSAYYHYLLHAYDIMKVFYSMGEGVRQNLNYKELCKMLLPNPTTSEQDEIVEYLNEKCAKIDEAIARQKDAVAKLEEYRKSIIYNAVTGKIDCRIGEEL